MSWRVRVIENRYADSVRLMGIARQMRERDGVEGCELAMGTSANLAVLRERGADPSAGPADLIIAGEATDDVAAGVIDDA
jgi:hypothetical protein